MHESIKIVPLGGLGEIGLNCTAFEYDGRIVVVDCGLMFPDERFLGVDKIIPDFSYLVENKDKIEGLVITHGHEDHIGAIPYLVKEFGLKIYARRFPLELIKSKLTEFKLLDKSPLHEVWENTQITLGGFKITFIPVSHSIIDSASLAIETEVGKIIFSGDFKEDLAKQEKINFDPFEKLGSEGVLLLMSDSTNVEREGHSLPEDEVTAELEKIIAGNLGRVIIAIFASNIERIRNILKIGKKLSRPVFLDGKSMEDNTAIAKKIGYIGSSLSLNTDTKKIKFHNDAIVLVTGCQAEPRSTLTRISLSEHKDIQIKSGDTVILSSRFIPGNEKPITRMVNNLYRLGATVFYETVSPIHVSGHGHREELSKMILATRPKFFVPIHGEYRHLAKHAKLAAALGVKKENILVVENGGSVILTKDKIEAGESVVVGKTFIIGETTGEIEETTLKDRNAIARLGMVICTIIMDRASGNLVQGPELFTKGFLKEDDPLVAEAKIEIKNLFAGFSEAVKKDKQETEEQLRLAIRRFFKRKLGIKPIVLPIIVKT